jgi:hypothetical protein
MDADVLGRTWLTEIGYPEPDRGPLQVLRSGKPAPEPQAEQVAA